MYYSQKRARAISEQRTNKLTFKRSIISIKKRIKNQLVEMKVTQLCGYIILISSDIGEHIEI